MNSSRTGLASPAGKNVNDASADREFAMFVRGVFTSKAGIHQQFGQIRRRDVLAWLQLQGSGHHPFWRRHTRQQCGRRRHQDSCAATSDCMQRPCPQRSDADMRRHATVRIHFVRRKWEDRPGGGNRRQSFQRRQEKLDISAGLLEVRVALNDIQDDAVRPLLRGGGNEECLCGRRQAGHDTGGDVHTAACDSRLQHGPKIERGRGSHENPGRSKISV